MVGQSAKRQNIGRGYFAARVSQGHSVDEDHALHHEGRGLRECASRAGGNQQLGNRRSTVHDHMLVPRGDGRRSIAWIPNDGWVNNRRRSVSVALAACTTLLVSCAQADTEPTAEFGTWCTPTDPGLSELSGLAWAGETGYAIGDRGSDDRLAVLNRDCVVARWGDVGVDTVDVEDIALDVDGTVWLADTGDNDAERDSVALIGLDVDDDSRRSIELTYPDGAHDVEAFVLTPTGAPVLITKVSGGAAAEIYTTAENLTAENLTAENLTGAAESVELVRVGAVVATAGDGSSRPITGAALDPDGAVGALRTKQDLFLFEIADGDVAAAFTGSPAAVSELPEQPQGEAVAFTDTGELLIGSEADGADELPPILFAGQR